MALCPYIGIHHFVKLRWCDVFYIPRTELVVVVVVMGRGGEGRGGEGREGVEGHGLFESQ